MLKFVVRSGGSNSTEEQRVNVKKDIAAPIINDILCNIVKRNTAINSVDKDRAKIQQQLGEDVFFAIFFTNEKQMCILSSYAEASIPLRP